MWQDPTQQVAAPADCMQGDGLKSKPRLLVVGSKSKGKVFQMIHAKLLQSCLTLCHPMDYSPPGSSDHGVLQTRITGVGCHSFSRGSSTPRDWTGVSYIFCMGRWADSLPLVPTEKLSIIYNSGKKENLPGELVSFPSQTSRTLLTVHSSGFFLAMLFCESIRRDSERKETSDEKGCVHPNGQTSWGKGLGKLMQNLWVKNQHMGNLYFI